MPVHLLIATPETAWEARLRRLAAALHWQSECARGTGALLKRLSLSRKGLVVVDWALLGEAAEARQHLSRLRKTGPHYIFILLGGPADLSAGRIALGLSCGADDILSKESSDGALFRKLGAYQTRLAAVETPADILAAGDLKADRARRKVFVRKTRGAWREVVGLNRKEFDLLWFFLRNPGMTFERAGLLSGVWRDAGGEVNPETVDKHVQNLRRKLGRGGRRIETVHGLGYVFRAS